MINKIEFQARFIESCFLNRNWIFVWKENGEKRYGIKLHENETWSNFVWKRQGWPDNLFYKNLILYRILMLDSWWQHPSKVGDRIEDDDDNIDDGSKVH